MNMMRKGDGHMAIVVEDKSALINEAELVNQYLFAEDDQKQQLKRQIT